MKSSVPCCLPLLRQSLDKKDEHVTTAGPLRWLPTFVGDRLILMLQKNPESKSMRDQKQGHNESRNEVSRSQLPCQEPGVIGLVESVQEVECAPEIEDPCDDNASSTWQ